MKSQTRLQTLPTGLPWFIIMPSPARLALLALLAIPNPPLHAQNQGGCACWGIVEQFNGTLNFTVKGSGTITGLTPCTWTAQSSAQLTFQLTNTFCGTQYVKLQGTGQITSSETCGCPDGSVANNSTCNSTVSGPLDLMNSTITLLISTNDCTYLLTISVGIFDATLNVANCDGTAGALPGEDLVDMGMGSSIPAKPLPPFGQHIMDTATFANDFMYANTPCNLADPGTVTMTASWDITPISRPVGIDVSEGSWPVNWNAAAAVCNTFGWTKATGYGTNGAPTMDKRFIQNMASAGAAGIPIGTYHFSRPSLHPGIAGADLEADYFWSVAGCYLKPGTLQPALDFENNSLGSIAANSQWVNEWCQRVVNYGANAGLTIRPLIYTDKDYANMLDFTVTQWPLWIANTGKPGVCLDGQMGKPSGIGPWPTWTAWQYQQDVATLGISIDVDNNVFNGTPDDLQSLIIQYAGPFKSGAVPLGPGCDTLNWYSICGSTYEIEYETSLAGPWIHLADVTATSTTASYTDCPGPGVDERFYRVLLLP